jgi:hypothetical protein
MPVPNGVPSLAAPALRFCKSIKTGQPFAPPQVCFHAATCPAHAAKYRRRQGTAPRQIPPRKKFKPLKAILAKILTILVFWF